MEFNLSPYQNNKRHPYPSLNHKASHPHTTTSQSHQQNSTNQLQTQATQWDLPITTQSLLSQYYLSHNDHHLPTQHPTVETITPKSSSNSQSDTNSFLKSNECNKAAHVRHAASPKQIATYHESSMTTLPANHLKLVNQVPTPMYSLYH